MTAILPKELLTATLGGLSLLVVSGGSDGDVLVQQSDGTYAPETLVTGDVFGPASSTDNAIARFDATTGKLLQNCVVTIGDTGNIAGLGTVSCGAITASGLLKVRHPSLTVGNSGDAAEILLENGIGDTRFRFGFVGVNGSISSPISGITHLLFGRDTGNVTIPTGTLTCGAITASGNISTTGSINATSIMCDGSTVFDTSGYRLDCGVGGGFNTLTVPVLLQVGGTTAAYPAWKRSGTTLSARLADDSADAPITCGALTASGLVCMSIYTVATLPSASANAYKEANVSDALAPAMGVAVVGGGSVKTKVRSNGTDWTVCGI